MSTDHLGYTKGKNKKEKIMLKKITFLAAASITALGLSACGSNDGAPKPPYGAFDTKVQHIWIPTGFLIDKEVDDLFMAHYDYAQFNDTEKKFKEFITDSPVPENMKFVGEKKRKATDTEVQSSSWCWEDSTDNSDNPYVVFATLYDKDPKSQVDSSKEVSVQVAYTNEVQCSQVLAD